jgi:GTPase SAR1 family protein
LTQNKAKAEKVMFLPIFFSGSPAYDSVRPLSYQEADVFLLCYKISDPISLYNVKNKWIRELRRHRTDVPVILCGCQSDLRSDPLTVAHLSKTGKHYLILFVA